MIRQLSEDVRGRLRTGVALTSVAQCVEELVLNSVDAGATCVAVRLDLQGLTVQVVDNGQGIGKDQLTVVGERYATSKCHSVEDLDNLRYFGYRGEALASLCSASSFVEIITRPAGFAATYSKCFHKGKPLAVTEPSRPRPGIGTTVTARSLFYNLPVRKKALNEGLELEKTRFRVAGLALMWPLISFSLRDEVTGNVILQTHKCSSVLGTFSSLFGAARTKHMRAVECSNEVFKVSGYVSGENYSRKDLQFVFVNKRLVLKSKVHKMVNSVLSKSVLVRRRGNGVEKSRQAGQGPGSAEYGSPTKLFERYAVYVINVECSVNVYDITFDPSKTLVEFHDWPELTSIVEAMLMKFLKEENLLLPTEESPETGLSNNPGEPDVSVVQTSEISETDDPFDGNDELIDEEFHCTLQRKIYAQGISTQSNINSLLSRTVRRPAAPQELEGSNDVCGSSSKKSRLNNSKRNVDERTPGYERHPKHDFFNGNERDNTTVLKQASGDPHPGSQGDIDVENTEVLTQRQLHETGKRQSSKDIVLKCSNTYLENVEDELMDEIILPKVHYPLKRQMHRSKHKQNQIEKLEAETSSSFSQSTRKGICLPQKFAQSSSLNRLRARLALQRASPSCDSSQTTPKVLAVSSNTTAAVLQKFHRTTKRNRRKSREVEQKVDCGEEMEATPTQGELPSAVRPSLFRSRSLDAKCSCCFVEDSSSHHRQSGTSVSVDVNTIHSSDDMDLSFGKSHRISGVMKQKSVKSRLTAVKQDDLVRKPGLHTADLEGSSLPSRFQRSKISHLRQNDHRKENGVRNTGKSSLNDYAEMTKKPRNASLSSFDKHRNISSSADEQVQGDKDPFYGHALSERKRAYGAQSTNVVSHTKPPWEASGDDQVASRLLEPHRSTFRLSHGSHIRPRPQHALSSSAKSSAVSHSSVGFDPKYCTSKPGRFSQASKLAQLMRKEHSSNCDSDTRGSQQTGNEQKCTVQRAHCSHSNAYEEAVHSLVTKTSTVNAHHKVQNAQSQTTHTQARSVCLDLTALEMLKSCQSSQSTLKPRDNLAPIPKTQEVHRPASHEQREKACHPYVEVTALEMLESCQVPQNTSQPRNSQNVQKAHCCQAAHSQTERTCRDLTALEMLKSCRPSQNTAQPREGQCLHSGIRSLLTRRYPELHLFETPQTVFKRSSNDSGTQDMTTQNSTEHRHRQETCHIELPTSDSLIDHARNLTTPRLTDYQTDVCSERRIHTGADWLSRTGDCIVPSSQTSASTLADRWKRRKEQVNPSGDASHTWSDLEAYTLGRHNSAAVSPVCDVSSLTTDVIEEVGRSSERWDPHHQNTQGFSALSSQGFLPQTTERDTLPFEMNATQSCLSWDERQPDSPVSAHSAGFSPVPVDPLLVDLCCHVTRSSFEPGVTHAPSSGVCPTSSGPCRLSHTQTMTERDAAADICLSQSGQHQTSNVSAGTCFSLWRDVQDQEVCASRLVSDLHGNVCRCRQMEHCPQQHKLAYMDTDSQAMSHQTSKAFSCTGQNSFTSNACQLSSDVQFPGCDQNSPLSNIHQVRSKHFQSSAVVAEGKDSEVIPLNRDSLTGTVSSLSVAPSGMTSSVPESAVGTCKVSSLETVSSSGVTSSLVVNSDSECKGGYSSLYTLTKPVEIITKDWHGTYRKPGRCQGDEEPKESNSEEKELSSVKECGREDPNSVCEHTDDNGKSGSCHQSFVPSSVKMTVVVPETMHAGLPHRGGRETKRKIDVDPAYKLSVLAGKKTRTSDNSESESSSLRQEGDLPANVPSCSERPSDTNKSANATVPPYRRTEGRCSYQLTDSFSDSLPDSALASVAMPEIQSVNMSTSVRNVSSTDSLPDSVLANITLSQKQSSTDPSSSSLTCLSPFTTDSVTDAALANVNTQDMQNQQKTENDSFISTCPQAASGVRGADVTLNNFMSQADADFPTQSKSSVCVTQNAYNLGLASSSACSAEQRKEGTSFVDPASGQIDTSGDDNSTEENRIHTDKDQPVSHGSVTAVKETWAIRDGEGECSEDENSAHNSRAALEGNGEVNEERQARSSDGGDRQKKEAWVPVMNPATGAMVYMNSSSGHTLTVAQWNEREMDQILNEDTRQEMQGKKSHTTSMKTSGPQTARIDELSPLSHGTLEALLSSHFEEEEAETQSKWREGSKVALEAEVRGDTASDILASWENPVFKRPEQILQTASRSQAGRVAHCFFPPTAFTKSMLAGAKVIGQLDNKFVACLIQEDNRLLPSTSSNSNGGQEGGLVVLFDQHAAHERVRLEQLLADVYEKGDGDSDTERRRIKRCNVEPPRIVDLSEEDVRLMQSFSEEFDRIGVAFEVDDQRRNRVHAHTIPACMAQREANDRKRGKDPLSYEYLQIMIKEHNQLLLSTAGAKQQLPQQVHRLLATHACKGAIKFGDKLSLSTCRELLSSLSSCDLPFQCAHGRPSIAPLLSLSQLRQAAPDVKCPPHLWKLQPQSKPAMQDQQ